MVAYGFKPFFEAQIIAGLKPQTVRGDRRRHAHPGEYLQLYVGLRTRHCRKIISDRRCQSVQPIVIESTDLIGAGIAFIEINGRPLNRDEIEEFACLDGFRPEWVNGQAKFLTGRTARENMGAFWRANHPEVRRFQGALISWEPPV